MTVEVLVCCGAGGAGKTTTAAALALGHARAGRRVVVLTIDPARRLADALGVELTGTAPTAVAADGLPVGARLDALMLDRKATWDEVITRHAPNPALAERLLANRYYDALSTQLTGGHEYMATEKLYQLATDGRWDLVVLDTPPSQHALDFFQAPARIRRLLDQRLLGALLAPTPGVFGAATRGVVDVVRRLAGPAVLDDLADFFGLIRDLSAGFRERGAAVDALLHAPTTRYLLVAHAGAPRTDEVLAFLDVLRADQQAVAGILLNRCVPPPGADDEALRAAVPGAPTGVAPEAWAATVALLQAAWRGQAREAAAHTHLAAHLAASARTAVWRVPDLDLGVADLDGLAALSEHLPPRAPPAHARP